MSKAKAVDTSKWTATERAALETARKMVALCQGSDGQLDLTRIYDLMRQWDQATPEERDAFRASLRT